MSDTRKDFSAWRPQGISARGLTFYALWDVDATPAYYRDWPQRLLGVYHRHLKKQEAWFAVRTAAGAGYLALRDGSRHELREGSFLAFPMAALWDYGSLAEGDGWVFRWYDFSGDCDWPKQPSVWASDPAEGSSDANGRRGFGAGCRRLFRSFSRAVENGAGAAGG